MALFSRRPKDTPKDSPAEASAPDDVVAPEPVDVAPDSTAPAEPSVGISVSSYRGLGSQAAAPAEPSVARAEASRREVSGEAETVPGLRDNVLLRESLARLGDAPTSQELMDVARQVMQGHLFLRVKGDARALLAEGKGLPLAQAKIGEKTMAVAYSSGAAMAASIRADGDTDTSAFGQPVLPVLRNVLAGTVDGLAIDPSSGSARIILSRPLIEQMLSAFDDQLTIKSLLAAERTDETPHAVAEALTRVPFWVAVNRSDDGKVVGVAEGRGPDGSRFLEVFSHPLEVVAMDRGDQPAPMSGDRLAKAMSKDEGITGVLIDPRGPWIRLSREELAPVLALAVED